MQERQLRPVGQLVGQFGVKSLAHGPPGSGKTPLIKTAPRPVLCATEPGLLSLRGSNVPCWEAFDANKMDEFWEWISSSNEAKNYDTICIDSISQMALLYLQRAQNNNKHGLAAYGQMARDTLKITEGLYFMKYKHVYLTCMQEIKDVGGGTMYRRPYFPGNEVNVQIPHRYDEILHVDKVRLPRIGETNAIETGGNISARCRDRSGMLNQFEPCDLTALFNKCMST